MLANFSPLFPQHMDLSLQMMRSEQILSSLNLGDLFHSVQGCVFFFNVRYINVSICVRVLPSDRIFGHVSWSMRGLVHWEAQRRSYSLRKHSCCNGKRVMGKKLYTKLLYIERDKWLPFSFWKITRWYTMFFNVVILCSSFITHFLALLLYYWLVFSWGAKQGQFRWQSRWWLFNRW